jgi:hypothetical protein
MLQELPGNVTLVSNHCCNLEAKVIRIKRKFDDHAKTSSDNGETFEMV